MKLQMNIKGARTKPMIASIRVQRNAVGGGSALRTKQCRDIDLAVDATDNIYS